MSAHAELDAEQRYLDHAYTLTDGTGTAPLIFGRLDLYSGSDSGSRFGPGSDPGHRAADTSHQPADTTRYVGRRHVTDTTGQTLVLAWYDDEAAPFYTADPATVRLKRLFVELGRQLVTLHDEIVDGSTPDLMTAREQLEQFRPGALHDVAATLTPQQFAAVTTEPTRILVVSGGPGTGKTQVGLHRAAWLAHRHPDLRDAGILVVVPSRALRHYVAAVLPGLDAADVTVTDIESIDTGRTYGHIVVDEAQDLSHRHLRTLAHACPSGSFTLLGELTYATRPGHLAGWADLTAPLGTDTERITLTTGFRVPSPIVDLLERQLPHLLQLPGDAAPITANRGGIGAPLVRHCDTSELVDDAARAAEAAAGTGFKVGLITAPARTEAVLHWALESGVDAGDVRAPELDKPVTVLAANHLNGLEFDAVALVAPDEIVKESGHAALYLAMSRCTQSLAIFHAEPLPAGLEHLDRSTPSPTANHAHRAPHSDLHALIDGLDDADKLLVETLVRRLLAR